MISDFCWQVFKHFGKTPKEYGRERDWNVDLIPKFLMANGENIEFFISLFVLCWFGGHKENGASTGSFVTE